MPGVILRTRIIMRSRQSLRPLRFAGELLPDRAQLLEAAASLAAAHHMMRQRSRFFTRRNGTARHRDNVENVRGKFIKALRAICSWRTILIVPLLLAASLALAGEQWTLKNDDTSLGVMVKGDQLIVASLSARPLGANWAVAPSPFPLPGQIFIEGAGQAVRWRFSGKSKDSPGRLNLRFTSAAPKLELVSIWQAHPGPGPIEHHWEVINHTGRTIELPFPPSLALTLSPPGGHALEACWGEKGASRPSDIGTHREPVRDGYEFKGRSTPYSDAPEMIPWYSLQDTAANSGLYFGVEFSGRVGIDLAAAGAPLELHVSAGLEQAGEGTRARLAPGERLETPTVFVGCYSGGLDDGANRLHRFVAEHLRLATHDKRYPLVVNNSWGSGMAVDEILARRMIDDAAALGVELFHIDAGWFREVGDWHPDSKKFPRGLAPIADYVHSKNMLFGLWVGWTQGGTEARGMETLSVTNPDQRDWFAQDYPANWKPSDFTGATVCLGDAKAREWCLRELTRIVQDYKLDLLEHDQVMILERCARTDHGHTSARADVAYRAARGYYDVYDRLRGERPSLLFEDCVNGGHTVDFGIVRRTHYISITDTYDPLSNRRAFYDASYPLPPSMCECYIENKPGGTLATFKAMLRSGMMGWCTLMCDTTAWTPEQHEVARRQIEIYKTWLRPLINRGELFHISDRPDDARWDAMEYIDPKTGKGVIYVFRGAKAEATSQTFQVAGLDAKGVYEVWSEDGAVPRCQAAGAKILHDGLTVNLGETGGSDLVYLQKRR